MDDVPEVQEAYPLGNTSMDWYRDTHEVLESEMDGFGTADVAYAGGTIYGAAHQGEYPESDVDVVESNVYAAALQSLAVDRMIETGDPDEARRALFLQPLMERDEEIDYYPDGMWMPVGRVEEVIEQQEEFIENDSRFPDSMVQGLNGYMNSFYGMHEEPAHTDEELRNVDFAFTKNDTYLGLPEELSDLEHPDLSVEAVQETDVSGKDVVYTNNVIDWFDDTEQFIDAVTDIGSENGFYLSTYTTGIHGSFESPEELANRIKDQTGRETEVVPSEATGKVHEFDRARKGQEATHHTETIEEGENGALVRIN